jgi:large subunit ribosomal protein L13
VTLRFLVGLFSLENLSMSTSFPSAGEIARKWYVVDAADQTLGRLASRVARILSGKENPSYTPFIDTGDHVVVINASKVKITGMKSEQKTYRHYTGNPGGLRSEAYNKRLTRRPEQVVEEAIKGMLPKTKLGRAMGSKLKVYRGDKHPHQAQKPEALKV